MKPDSCIVSAQQDRLVACHNITLLVVQTHRVLFFVCVFIWSSSSELLRNFLINSHGRAEAFSQKHYLLKHTHTHTPLHPLPARVCTRDEGQTTKTFKQWAQSQTEGMWLSVRLERWFSRFKYKLFLTVLRCPAHMILWTKGTFGWEMAAADCPASRPQYRKC